MISGPFVIVPVFWSTVITTIHIPSSANTLRSRNTMLSSSPRLTPSTNFKPAGTSNAARLNKFLFNSTTLPISGIITRSGFIPNDITNSLWDFWCFGSPWIGIKNLGLTNLCKRAISSRQACPDACTFTESLVTISEPQRIILFIRFVTAFSFPGTGELEKITKSLAPNAIPEESECDAIR